MTGRILAASFATLALVGGIAAGPTQQASSADHDVVLTPGEAAHVDGGAPGGINYTPIVTGGTQPEPTCTHDPSTYCESTLVMLSADVPDDAPRGRVTSTFALTLDAVAPVADFDVYVFQSDETGARGARLDTSGALAGGQVAPAQDGILWRCPGSDECIEMSVSFRQGDEPEYLLVEVHYSIAPVSYVMDLSLS